MLELRRWFLRVFLALVLMEQPRLWATPPPTRPGGGFEQQSFDGPGGFFTLGPWVGRAVQAGEDPAALATHRNQAEPHLARSPVTDDLLLATFQEGRWTTGGARDNGVAVSLDGGFTWDRKLVPGLSQLSGGPYYRATDPVVAIDRQNRFYLQSLVAVDSAFAHGRVVVQWSDDLGATWTAPVTIYDGLVRTNNTIFPDKNWMAVNAFADTPTAGRVVATWTNFRDITLLDFELQDAPIMIAFSDDRGASWSPPRFVSPEPVGTISSTSYQGSQPVFLPDGALAVLFHEFTSVSGDIFSEGALRLAYSADGGTTFSAGPELVVPRYYIYRDSVIRNAGFLPSMAVAAATGDLYIAYSARFPGPGDRARIVFLRSDRKGATNGGRPVFNWTAPRAVDAPGPTGEALFGTIAVSPDGSAVSISYYTRRNASAGTPTEFDHYVTQSFDGGESWTAQRLGDDLRITPETFDASLATFTASGYMIGDYFGLVAPNRPDDAFALCWIDTRSGESDPYVARLASVAEPFEGWSQVHFNAGERAGGAIDGSSDFDGDTVFDQLEFWIGSDPRDAQSPSGPSAGSLQIGRLSAVAMQDPAVEVSYRSGIRPDTAAALGFTPAATVLGEGFWDLVTYPWNADGLHLLLSDGVDTYAWSSDPYPWKVTKREGGDWFLSAWFGTAYDRAFPWVFHYGLGWLYAGTADEDALWLWSPRYGWCYTERSAYPYLYVLDASDWWYYDTTSKNAPRWFYSAKTGAWIQR